MRYSPTTRKKYKVPDYKVELSIVTVNYNGLNDTCEMIRSILENIKSVEYEIIVVDNGSRKNEATLLHKRFPFIRALRSEKNLGFAGGNNLALPVAAGRYIFFLNNDTYVTDDHFRELIDALESHPDAAAVSPLIRYAQEEGQPVQFAGFTPLSHYTLRNRGIGHGDLRVEKYLSPSKTPYLHGAAMLVKSEVVCYVCRLPEMYFLYFEELDWCESLLRIGYRFYYEPCCTVYHKESRSTGVDSPLKVFYMTRNRFLFAYRNRSTNSRCICFCYLLGLVVPRDIITHLRNKRYSQAKAVWRGVCAYFKLKKEQKTDKDDITFSYCMF